MLKEGFAGTFRKFNNGFAKEGSFKGFAWVFTQGFLQRFTWGVCSLGGFAQGVCI